VKEQATQKEDPVRLMFQDEGRFGRLNDPRRCWAPMGTRPRVPKQMVREYTYVFSAVSPHDGVMDSLILPSVSANMMSLFLKEVSQRHANEFIVMVADQAGWHRANDLKVPENMLMVWLPPYSPECNPAEHLWEEIREKWFGNDIFNSMTDVERTLMNALSILEQEPSRVHKLAGFDWIVSIPLIAN
jgi:hypothetical protein